MIQGKKICKSFDGFKALNEASFHVQKGAVYGLVGPNGAGKSTLLRHITGVFRQDSGQILVDGEEVYENPAVKECFEKICSILTEAGFEVKQITWNRRFKGIDDYLKAQSCKPC